MHTPGENRPSPAAASRASARGAVVAVMLLTALLGVAPAARAGQVSDSIFKPLEDEAARVKTYVAEVDRVGAERIAELEEWVAFFQRQKEQLGVQTKLLNDWYEANRKRLEQAAQTLQGMQQAPDGTGWVPQFGWIKAQDLQQQAANLKAEYDKLQGMVNDGTFSFHVHFIGWVSGRDLDGRIKGLREEIAGLQRALGEGSYGVNLAGVGVRSKRDLKARLDELQAEKERIGKSIADGTYAVHVHHLGWVTRNGINERLKQLDQEMADLSKRLAERTFPSFRPLLGRFDANGLAQLIAGQEKEVAEWKRNVSDDVFSAHFPQTGWLNGKQLKENLQNANKKVEEINQAVGKGEYPVGIPGSGVVNRLQITERIKQINDELTRLTGVDGAAEARKNLTEELTRLQKGLADLAKASALDVALWVVDKSRWTSWLAPYLKLAEPWLEAKKLTLDQYARHQGDFAKDVELALKPLRDERAKWERALDLLP